MYSVLNIDNSTNTLRLARQDFLGESFCNATFTGTTLTPELFELSPNYKTLFVYYLCEPHLHNPTNFTCPKIGVASVHRNNENHEKCGASFNITVPTKYAPEEGALNLTRLGSVLKEGFVVKLKIDERPCQECQSSDGICGYYVANPVCCKTNSSSDIKCNPMIPYGSNGLSKQAKLGIGFACGFLGATLLAGCLFCFFIRRRKKLAAQYTNKGLSTVTPYSSNNTMSLGIGVACGFLGLRKRTTSHHLRYQNLKALLQLKRYTYAEVKKITKSFSHTVGKGGFGTVYGGNLCDGRKVAVKILKDFKGNGEDFINEVASMSQTSHVNIVSLLGFCYEGSKRAIVYEFLENGSLDQFISRKKPLNLDVTTLYGIGLGVARGLEYLHHGCKTRIVHFDIKPQNVLEMIGARNKETVENAASNSSSAYFPDWIYKDLENGEHVWKFGDEITREEEEIAKKMTLVGLWCIQPCPTNRPPMNRVVEMMEGSLDALEVPPRPSLHMSAVPLA